jgi:hypothetical protein
MTITSCDLLPFVQSKALSIDDCLVKFELSLQEFMVIFVTYLTYVA